MCEGCERKGEAVAASPDGGVHQPAGVGRSGASRNYTGPWPRTPARLAGTGLVRLYQLTLSGFVGGHCRHLPTCSEYAYEAVARHGLVRGSWLAARRVARCGPFGAAGIDPVPVPAERSRA